MNNNESVRVTRLDIYIFVGAFAAGITSYVLLRAAGAGQLWQTLAIILVMGAYGAAVAFVPRLKVRMDQAGDNAYYLGLLFTLASMAFALWEFREITLSNAPGSGRSGAAHIIANFGIALASTILGILMRVVLHQMRVDPADVEGMTRIELAEAAKRVKAQLDMVTTQIALFHDQVRQRMTDVITTATDDVTKTLSGFTEKVGSATSELLTRTEHIQTDAIERVGATTAKLDELAESARASIERLQKVEPPPLKLATRLEKISETLETLRAPVDDLTRSLKETATEATNTMMRIREAATDVATLSTENRAAQRTTLKEIESAATGLRGALEAAGTTLQQDKRVLMQIEIQARQIAKEATRTQEAASTVMTTLTQAARDLTTTIRGDDPPNAPRPDGHA